MHNAYCILMSHEYTHDTGRVIEPSHRKWVNLVVSCKLYHRTRSLFAWNSPEWISYIGGLDAIDTSTWTYAFAYLVVVGAMVIILKYFLGCLSRCTRIEADSAGSTLTSVVGSGWHERCHPTRLMRRRLDFRSSRYRSRVTSSTRRHVYPDSAGVT